MFFICNGIQNRISFTAKTFYGTSRLKPTTVSRLIAESAVDSDVEEDEDFDDEVTDPDFAPQFSTADMYKKARKTKFIYMNY